VNCDTIIVVQKVLFIILTIILLAALGAVFWFWWQAAGQSSAAPTLPPQKTFASNESSSAQKTLPLVTPEYKKPDENSVIKLPVFNYHHIRPIPPASAPINDRSFTVTPEGFENHLKYFKDNGYQTISVYDLLNYFDTGQPLPPKAVIITFDDARYGQYKWAFPLLKQYGMVGHFFVTTGWIGRQDILTWSQIKEMSENGMIIGSHSISHANEPSQNDADLRHELVDSKKIIEEKIGKIVDLLAYPGGGYDNRVIKFAQDSGYIAAMGVYKIIDQSPKYRYAIRRFHADDALESITSKLTKY